MPDAHKVLSPKGEAVPTTIEGLKALLKRTQAGDQTALPLVRKMVNDPTHLRMFGGELAETVVKSFVKAINADDIGFREAVLKKLELMRAELLGDSPTPVERLLVERIAACWLQVQDAELRYAQGQSELTIKQAEFHQRRIDAANKRFLAAIKSLALVRKLAVPALQINVAKKQVNVVAPAVVPTGAAD